MPVRWAAWAALLTCIALAPACRETPAKATRRAGPPNLVLPGLDRVFRQHLPGLVIALNQPSEDRPARLDGGREAIRSACSGGPDDICKRLDELVVALYAAAVAEPGVIDLVSVALSESKRRLNRALAANDAAYFVDAAVLELDGKRVVLALSFSLEETRFYRAGDRRIPVLLVRRLDRLNWSYDLLGFASAADDEAVVLVDVVDSDIASALGTAGTGTAANSLHWRALGAELGGGQLDDLQATFATRTTAWSELRTIARTEANVEVDESKSVGMPAEIDELAARLMPSADYQRLRSTQDTLASHPALATLRDLHKRRISIHEAQHRVDVRAPPGAALAIRALQGIEKGDRSTYNAELSAYLAEIAHSPETARSSIGLLALFIYDGRLAGTAEQNAAIIILDALGPRLGVAKPRDASKWELETLNAETISAAARDEWQHQFGAKLRPLKGP